MAQTAVRASERNSAPAPVVRGAAERVEERHEAGEQAPTPEADPAERFFFFYDAAVPPLFPLLCVDVSKFLMQLCFDEND